jgi:predicted TPR repeat methyltransferase
VAFRRVLETDSGNIEARYRLANSLKELRRWAEAEREYRRVLELDARHSQSFNNLGTVLEMQGRAADASESYRQAIERDPALAQPYANLGRLLQSLGKTSEAADVFERALAAGLDPDYFGHLVSSARGAASPRAPDSYVRGTFDAFAENFDRQLGELGYRVPHDLSRLVRERGWFDEALDLGCGTGLVGDALAGAVGRLVGVDLSGAMLERARRRSRYAELHAAEVGEWLRACDAARFDLVVSADVFIYIGALEDTFAEVARCLRPGGAFAFSVETVEAMDWQLRPTGRYAQSPAYVTRLAAQNAFAVARREPAVIRRGIAGELYLLSARA